VKIGVTWTLVDLAGFVALLLWGVHMVQTGVQRALGARLRIILGTALSNRFKAFAAGLGVTAVLQSSTATGLMTAGFVGEGLVALVPALAVMLGANVGTTLIVQVLSFNISMIAPLLVLIGVVLFRRAWAGLRDFGRVMIGLGLILLALHQFIDLLHPLTGSALVREAVGQLSGQLVFLVLLAAVLAWAAHSSVAIVLLAMSLAGQGVMPAHAAFALVLGANLGAAVNPVVEGGASAEGRRLPLGNLFNRIVGVVAVLAVFPWVSGWMARLEADPARAVADFHTAFNLVLALAFFPWLGSYARLLERLLPARAQAADPGAPLYLEPLARETPVIALGAASREALRMADALETMLAGLKASFEKADRKGIGELRRADDVLDRLNRAIKAYVTGLDPEAATEADHRRVAQILTFATNLEQAGDVVDKGLLALIAKGLKRDLVFTPEHRAELAALTERLVANLRTAASLFTGGDERGARVLMREKEAFREFEAAAVAAHFAELRGGSAQMVETSALYVDALRDLKRLNAHLVEGAAYPILEASGELLASRLRA
jgi:phosphate:Na+ symporter